MFAVILFVAALAGLMLAIALGWTSSTASRGRYWYSAGPDPEPWHND